MLNFLPLYNTYVKSENTNQFSFKDIGNLKAVTICNVTNHVTLPNNTIPSYSGTPKQLVALHCSLLTDLLSQSYFRSNCIKFELILQLDYLRFYLVKTNNMLIKINFVDECQWIGSSGECTNTTTNLGVYFWVKSSYLSNYRRGYKQRF